MQLPISLQQALEQMSEQVPLAQIKAAYQQLSDSYRAGENSLTHFKEPATILAYLLARMPATYAAVYKALESVKERLIDSSYKTLLDIGAGPGTASWAATELFPELTSITLFEQSPEILSVGKKLASSSDLHSLQNSRWIGQNITEPFAPPKADMAIFSYVCSEVDCSKLIIDLWQAGTTLVIIEPGTPKGFATILKLRKELLTLGAHIVAPCPHHFSCPMTTSWCHFPARIERTKIHKLLKGGSLGYEDEKYSYLVVSPTPPSPIEARVVGIPLRPPKHIKLPLCTKEGTLELKTFTKKQKNLYRQARNADWGASIKTPEKSFESEGESNDQNDETI
ncbi:MAG: small ribosomal subunit Rsm22 family protein [Chlamydiales bacterium]|nr:small ribosomal subunit Rsm22 family protein [Chlamydiales bacterium]